MAASAPPFRPVDTWRDPPAVCTSSAVAQDITLPTIRRKTSPTPIGRTCGSASPGVLLIRN